ncbi:MAG: hypothetical protein DI628_02400 [Blastochloris viridis]|uniref:Uncharacterized protein n=1 Tax=Blastochloris viridis TaxID=1079 RepID=A0A6N4RBT5_BLAVI|nr:MAG: hypothetical protein DI628_02400 [Blastochloris viridis]
MGIFWNTYRKMLPHDVREMVDFIEKEVEAGRMSEAEAEQRRAELEKTLHGIFDAEEDKENA